MIHQELAAPCGLYCGVCGIYRATVTNDQKLKEKLAKAYGDAPEKINCRGCLSRTVYWYCSACPVKSCAAEKKLEGCHQCNQFPCDKIETFPVEEGKRNILRGVLEWRRLGTADFFLSEEKRFTCPKCQTLLFRGTRKCRNCNELLTAS